MAIQLNNECEKKYQLPKTSLDEKIDFIEEYIRKTGEEIHTNTVYKGYPIGEWTIQLRSLIKNQKSSGTKKISITDKQKARLQELGTLEPRIDSKINDKIRMVINWQKKYPKLTVAKKVPDGIIREYAKSDDEYEELYEKFQKMKKYYEYIKSRKSAGKLTQRQINRCTNGNIGGVFGKPEFIKELAMEYEQSEKEMHAIINEYGSVEEFVERYRESSIDDVKERDFAKCFIRDVIDVDSCEENRPYNDLYMDIVGKREENKIELYSSESLKEVIKGLSLREQIIVEEVYGIKPYAKPHSYTELSKQLNISRERVRQLIIKILETLRKPEKIYKFSCNLCDKEQEFITDDDKEKYARLVDLIFESDLIFKKSSYNPSEQEEIYSLLEYMKKMNNSIVERKKEKLDQLLIEDEKEISGLSKKYFRKSEIGRKICYRRKSHSDNERIKKRKNKKNY